MLPKGLPFRGPKISRTVSRTSEQNKWAEQVSRTSEQNKVGLGGPRVSSRFQPRTRVLWRLDTDNIDLLQVPRSDRTVQIEETMKAIHELLQSESAKARSE